MFESLRLHSVLLALPLVSLGVGWVISRLRRDGAESLLLRLRVFEFVAALAILIETFVNRSLEFTFFKASLFNRVNVDFGLRGDELSSIVLAMVTLLSLCIFRYSIRYLDGDKRRVVFFRNFQLTVFAVTFLTLSNNLLMFFAAWLGSSYGLHQLLLHFNERPQAILAARKKWWVSRIGDVCLLAGIVLTYIQFGTFNFTELFAIANDPQTMTAATQGGGFFLIGLLFVIGAMTKSAQFPFHFWLPETMETPTPVSALMHAGIINAGGYLIIRLSPILAQATIAHALLTVVGGVTAVFGALAMMTQTDVKRSLAYSTISQLGFMMIQCGLGLYALALFHIIAHGFYKAHAFLSTGAILEDVPAPKRNLSNFGLALSYLIATGLVILGLNWDSDSALVTASLLIYFGILVLALTQVIGSRKELASGLKNNPLGSLTYLTAGFSIYVAFDYFGGNYLSHVAPARLTIDGIWIASVISVFALFTLGIYFAKRMQDLSEPWGQKLWMFFWNGGYIPQISTRLFR
jgi:NAD(P)H-quinone oxidoreductase subunit 5